MPSQSQNLGQVAGVHIGQTPPQNINLIWYDDTPSQMFHKVYDVAINEWVPLNQDIISVLTYSELVGIAQSTGLSIGKQYRITDLGNVLATAITITKVMYVDAIGNILIDDLGTNIQYHVTSSNLQIDNIAGVWDAVNRKLVFTFNADSPDINNDYLYGTGQRSGVWGLLKYKLTNFLSQVTGNSIQWNGGFYFNFANAIQGVMDLPTGVVSMSNFTYTIDMLWQAVNNVGNENANLLMAANNYTDLRVRPVEIYGKALDDMIVPAIATDIAIGNTLRVIVAKCQAWFNQLQWATGVRLTNSFLSFASLTPIHAGDTVEAALAKTQAWITSLSGAGGITVLNPFTPGPVPEVDIVAGDTIQIALQKTQAWINRFKRATGIQMSADYTPGIPPFVDPLITSADTLDSAIRKLHGSFNTIQSALPPGWVPSDYTTVISDLAAGDTFVTAFAKIQGKLNQIGDISNGQILSKQKTGPSNSPLTKLDLRNGVFEMIEVNTSGTTIRSSTIDRGQHLISNQSLGTYVKNDGTYGVYSMGISANEEFNVIGIPDNIRSANVLKGIPNSSSYGGLYTALHSRMPHGVYTGQRTYDAILPILKTSGLSFTPTRLRGPDSNPGYVTLNAPEYSTVYFSPSEIGTNNIELPATSYTGCLIVVVNRSMAISGGGTLTVSVNSNSGVRLLSRISTGWSADLSHSIPSGNPIAMYMYASSSDSGLGNSGWIRLI